MTDKILVSASPGGRRNFVVSLLEIVYNGSAKDIAEDGKSHFHDRSKVFYRVNAPDGKFPKMECRMEEWNQSVYDDILERANTKDTIVSVHGPSRYVAEINDILPGFKAFHIVHDTDESALDAAIAFVYKDMIGCFPGRIQRFVELQNMTFHDAVKKSGLLDFIETYDNLTIDNIQEKAYDVSRNLVEQFVSERYQDYRKEYYHVAVPNVYTVDMLDFLSNPISHIEIFLNRKLDESTIDTLQQFINEYNRLQAKYKQWYDKL